MHSDEAKTPLNDSTISAVSNVDGQIVYHSGRRPSGSKKTKKIQSITSLQGDNKAVTEKSNMVQLALNDSKPTPEKLIVSSPESEQDHISLFINPFKLLSTDFDDYFDEEKGKEEKTANLKSKKDHKPAISSKSCTQLDQEAGSYYL